MSDTPTPRCDALSRANLGLEVCWQESKDYLELARTLERELTAANERIDKLTAQLASCRKSLGEAMAYVHYNDVEDDADWQRWKRDRDGTEGAAK
jgi:hypothetical protein